MLLSKCQHVVGKRADSLIQAGLYDFFGNSRALNASPRVPTRADVCRRPPLGLMEMSSLGAAFPEWCSIEAEIL
jgi:hypothetical protein